MIPDAIAKLLALIVRTIGGVLPAGHLTLPGLGGFGTALMQANLVLPFWGWLGPLLAALLVAVPAFTLWRAGFWVYHQFWGSN